MTKVFVHGNPETAAIWGSLTDALTERGLADETVLLSPPGFGAPTPDGWEPTPAAYVDWLARSLAAIDGPIDLVGHDWGAGHVFGLLDHDPSLVRSWAADCVGLLHPDYVWHDMAQVWQTPEAGEESIAGMIALGPDARTQAFGDLGLTPEVARSMAEAVDDEMGRCVLGLYRAAAQPALVELGRRVMARSEAGALPPGLVIEATDDAYVGAELGAAMADRLGAGRLVLQGQGHWWMTDPAVAADGLIAFWSALDSGQEGSP